MYKKLSSLPVRNNKKSILKQKVQHSCQKFYHTRASLHYSKNNYNLRSKVNLEKDNTKIVTVMAKTTKDSLNLQKFKGLNEVKERHDNHFNDHLIQQIQKQYSEQLAQRNKSKSKRNQNLKNISKYMNLLIANNKNLTVKELGHLLYQIIGNTRLGLELIQQNCMNISPQLKNQLTLKYQDQHKSQSVVTKHLIRNVRRRMYDALNVMISANVVKKSDKSFQLVGKKTSKVDQIILSQLIRQQDEQKLANKNKIKQQLQNKTNQTLANIETKKKILQETKQKYQIMKALFQINTQNKPKKQIPVFQFPLLMIKHSAPVVIQCKQEELMVRSNQKLNVLGDMQIIELKLKTNQNNQSEIEIQQESISQYL